MWRRDKGFRVGTTRTRLRNQPEHIHGLQLRSMQEHADAAWVLSTHDTEGQARAAEQLYALKYGIPDASVRRSPGGEHERPRPRPGADRQRVRGRRFLRAWDPAAPRAAPRFPRAAPRAAVVRGATAQRHDDALRRSARSASGAPVAIGGRDEEMREQLDRRRIAGSAREAWLAELALRVLFRRLRTRDRDGRAHPVGGSGDGPSGGAARVASPCGFMPACVGPTGDGDVRRGRVIRHCRIRRARSAGATRSTT